jgi:UDP-glucose 6-dehydrogenase
MKDVSSVSETMDDDCVVADDYGGSCWPRDVCLIQGKARTGGE